MLIHMPVYVAPGEHADQLRYLLELALASLDSYYAHGNRQDVLVTTNDRQVFQELSRYRWRARQPFALAYISEQNLSQAFGAAEWQLRNPRCLRYVMSKFYPVVRRHAKQIVHVDYDTLFLSRVDFSPLFASEMGVIDANQLGGPNKWRPNTSTVEFFRMDRARIRPVANWINSGVFSVQRGGFELCSSELERYLSRLGRATKAGYDDESILNALAVREPGRVAVIRDFRFNFLAYNLGHDPNWLKMAKIVHFHRIKPQIFGTSHGNVEQLGRTREQWGVTEDFYLAVLLWSRHLHTASRHIDLGFRMLQAMPLEVVTRELQRVMAIVTRRATVAGGARGPATLAAFQSERPSALRVPFGANYFGRGGNRFGRSSGPTR
jgi:hypothetical protein